MDIQLTNEDLKKNNNAYDEETIIKNIDNLSLFWILVTQKVSAEFCVTYFWAPDDKYAKNEHDEEIYLSDILYWQKHLTENDIHTCPEYLRRLATGKENQNQNQNQNQTQNSDTSND